MSASQGVPETSIFVDIKGVQVRPNCSRELQGFCQLQDIIKGRLGKL